MRQQCLLATMFGNTKLFVFGFLDSTQSDFFAVVDIHFMYPVIIVVVVPLLCNTYHFCWQLG